MVRKKRIIYQGLATKLSTVHNRKIAMWTTNHSSGIQCTAIWLYQMTNNKHMWHDS